MGKNFWLVKSEPEVYSIDSLEKDMETPWEGVRNYQARNFMRDSMCVGDKVLFYHSNADPTGVAGVATVSSPPIPDETQFNKKSEYFDPKATPQKPNWICVKIAFKEKFKTIITLAEIKSNKALKDMVLVQPGSRLSVQPVTQKQFETILGMARRK